MGFLSISIFLGRTVCNFLKMWDEVSRNNWLLILCIMVPNSSTSEVIYICTHPKGNFLNRGAYFSEEEHPLLLVRVKEMDELTCFGMRRAFFTVLIP